MIFLRTKLASQWEGKGGGGRKKWIPSFLPPFLNRFLPMEEEEKGNRTRRICPPNFFFGEAENCEQGKNNKKSVIKQEPQEIREKFLALLLLPLPLLLPVSHPHTLPPSPSFFFPLKDPLFPYLALSVKFIPPSPPSTRSRVIGEGEDDSYDHRRRSEKGGQIKRQGCQVLPGIRCSSSAMSGARSQTKKLGKRGCKIKVFLAHLATLKV